MRGAAHVNSWRHLPIGQSRRWPPRSRTPPSSARNGTLAVSGGRVVVEHADAGGRDPELDWEDGVVVLVDGLPPVARPCPILYGQTVEAVTPDEEPRVELFAELSRDRMGATLSVERHPGGRFRLEDQPANRALQLRRLLVERVPCAPPSLEAVDAFLYGRGITHGVRAGRRRPLPLRRGARRAGRVGDAAGRARGRRADIRGAARDRPGRRALVGRRRGRVLATRPAAAARHARLHGARRGASPVREAGRLRARGRRARRRERRRHPADRVDRRVPARRGRPHRRRAGCAPRARSGRSRGRPAGLRLGRADRQHLRGPPRAGAARPARSRAASSTRASRSAARP